LDSTLLFLHLLLIFTAEDEIVVVAALEVVEVDGVEAVVLIEEM
jgi:hypothetical protein